MSEIKDLKKIDELTMLHEAYRKLEIEHLQQVSLLKQKYNDLGEEIDKVRYLRTDTNINLKQKINDLIVEYEKYENNAKKLFEPLKKTKYYKDQQIMDVVKKNN